MKKLMKMVWLLLPVAGIFGCSAKPELRIEKIDSTTAIMAFNWGPLIKQVDQEGEMMKYCFPSMPKVLEAKDEQLSGQYRFLKKIKFTCTGVAGQHTQPNMPQEPLR